MTTVTKGGKRSDEGAVQEVKSEGETGIVMNEILDGGAGVVQRIEEKSIVIQDAGADREAKIKEETNEDEVRQETGGRRLIERLFVIILQLRRG